MKIYLAGPDVFFNNTDAVFAELQALCQKYGAEGMVPSDGGLSKGVTGTGDAISQLIFDANIAMIERADAVLANLMPFRNVIEPDSGTVFEIGYACALKKPIAGYMPERAVLFEDRIKAHFGVEARNGQLWDMTHGFAVERFQQPLNLMISRSVPLFDTAEAAIAQLTQGLRRA